MLIDNLDQIPVEFTMGYRGILLLKRHKDGESGNADRKAIKKISSDTWEWMEIVKEFDQIRKTNTAFEGHRIYANINARDIQKAIREFKRRQLDADYEEGFSFYTDIQNRFFSCFMTPSSKDEAFFIFDCDTYGEYQDCIDRLPKDVIKFDYATKNGRHIVTSPFNWKVYNLMEPKKDDLLAIG